MTSAWVSPRVNRAEPCGARSSPTLAVIGRMSVVARPSMRGLPSRMSSRITLPRRSCRISFTSADELAAGGLRRFDLRQAAELARRVAERRDDRLDHLGVDLVERLVAQLLLAGAAGSPDAVEGHALDLAQRARRPSPAAPRRASACRPCATQLRLRVDQLQDLACAPKRSASSTAASETCFAPPSTMTSAFAEPATMSSRSAASISRVGRVRDQLAVDARDAHRRDRRRGTACPRASAPPTRRRTRARRSRTRGPPRAPCAVTCVSSR